jgi:hypothetical protein
MLRNLFLSEAQVTAEFGKRWMDLGSARPSHGVPKMDAQVGECR